MYKLHNTIKTLDLSLMHTETLRTQKDSNVVFQQKTQDIFTYLLL